jgi:hypothetical protein
MRTCRLLAMCRLAAGHEPDGLATIVRTLRARTRQDEVTGGLLFDGELIAHWLEGDAAVVRAVYEFICAQPICSSARLLWRGIDDGARGHRQWRAGYLEPGALEPLVAAAEAGHDAAALFAALLERGDAA